MTQDASLIDMLQALEQSRNVLTVSSEFDLTGALLGARIGVAILDAALMKSSMGELVENLRAQFPDLVLIVAGRLNDQSVLAAQITDGTVYRFLHKPVSEQRVRLFVEAAWRRHQEQSSGSSDIAAAEPPRQTRTPKSPGILALVAAVACAAVLTGAWWVMHDGERSVATSRQPSASLPAVTSTDPEQLDLLNRAGRAIEERPASAGTLATAATLYGKALERNRSDARALAGLQRVIDELLSAAEAQLGARHLEEAQKLAEQARSIEPDHPRVAFLMAQIVKARERLLATPARIGKAAIPGADGAVQPPNATAASVAATADATPSAAVLTPALPVVTPGAADTARHATETTPSAAEAGTGAVANAVETAAPRAAQAADPPAGTALPPPSSATRDTIALPVTAATTANSAEGATTPTNTEATATAVTGVPPAETALHPANPQVVTTIAPLAADGTGTADPEVPASSLVVRHYSAPVFPVSARERGVSGWVDLRFVVKKDGSVANVVVTGAEPTGVFDQAALAAVRRWRYEPVTRKGLPIEQATRLHMRFALRDSP